ncbi:hypothetical protein JCM15060_13990 [Halanaerobaculum tunisiense]
MGDKDETELIRFNLMANERFDANKFTKISEFNVGSEPHEIVFN